jgi:hypothetical protein
MVQQLPRGKAKGRPGRPTRKDQERRSIQEGLCDTADGAGGAEPRGGKTYSRAIRQVALGRGHDGPTRLVVGQEKLNLLPAAGLDEIQGSARSRHAIDPPHARLGQKRRDYLHGGCHDFSGNERNGWGASGCLGADLSE